MNDITNHIKKAADSVRLSEIEKHDMKHILREYMAHKPFPQEGYSSVSIHWFSFSWIKQPLAAALALVFIFGGGVSFAAESALPGDALYSVKTKVNESVKVALATDTEAKANIQMELAERRIEEAAALAAENRLDTETESELAAAFEAHAESATQEVATIDEEDSSAAAEITSRFEMRLAAHEAVLSLVSENADATNTLTDAIRVRGLAVADIRARAEERMAVSAPIAVAMSLAMDAADSATDTMTMKAAPATMMAAPTEEPASEARTMQAENAAATTNEATASVDSRAAARMKASAEAQLKAAQKKLRSSKTSGEVRAQAEAELAIADDRIEEGRTFIKDKAHAQAYHAFQQSLVISERLNVMLKSKTALQKANERAADTRANGRTKAEEPENRPAADIELKADIEATATPIQLEVESDIGTTVHEVVPVIPPPLRIFRFDDDHDDRGVINIGF
jgi:hypothetical protein